MSMTTSLRLPSKMQLRQKPVPAAEHAVVHDICKKLFI